ncbi:hypothetical protein CFP75_39775 [Amycolatopsis alba DSM 44262]|uniref:DUF5753 domain-containing protein n=1 Tax=Amycolatopsis alba DSM 44262 TaxID=1125972 RepID=A0A229R8Z3_AMYAL|nr:hypothetical protein CFP75_39775 [Amycolatopsis alba DSM 44262]
MINGHIAATRLDVGKFLLAANASTHEIGRLSTLAGLSPRAHSVQAHPADVPDMLPTLRFLETTAVSITSYDPHQLPLLLQTTDCTETMLRGTELLTDETVTEGAAARQERQSVLCADTGPVMTSYIGEHVLNQPLPGRVAAGQRRHLHTMVQRLRWHVRIIPATAPVTAWPGFALFQDDHGNEVITVRTPTAQLVLDDPGNLATYRQAIAQLAAAALPDTESTARLLAPDTFNRVAPCRS